MANSKNVNNVVLKLKSNGEKIIRNFGKRENVIVFFGINTESTLNVIMRYWKNKAINALYAVVPSMTNEFTVSILPLIIVIILIKLEGYYVVPVTQE